MSKASEYAKVVGEHKKVFEFAADDRCVAHVSEHGNVFLHDSLLVPGEALRLAAWIVDTFGESESPA